MRDLIIHPRIKYVRELFTTEDDALKLSLEAMDSLGMRISIGPEDGKLLQVLIKMINAKKAVEIGTLTGYSSIWIARALGNGGILYSLEKNHGHARIAVEIMAKAGLDSVVEVIEGDAEQSIFEISKEAPFDFIFIDANKSAYPKYLDWSYDNLRSGGIIVADNTYLFDSVYLESRPENIGVTMWNAMKEFNKLAADESRFESIMIPTSEGLTLLLKK